MIVTIQFENSLHSASSFEQMHKSTAQEALRNAPCLYKVWTYILYYKVQGPFSLIFFLSPQLFIPAVRTLGLGMRSCGWSPGCSRPVSGGAPNMLSASWGRRASSPPSASTRAGEEKKTNCLALQEGHKHQSIPAPTCSLVSLKDLIHLCVGAAPHGLLCTSKLRRLPSSLCISIHPSVHLSTVFSGQTAQRKVLTKDFSLLY